MEAAVTLFGIWFAHAAVGIVLAGPILFLGRKRAGWASWQFLAFIVPYSIWAGLMLSPLATDKKSLANLGEPVYISFAMPVLALLRLAIGRRVPERFYAASFVVGLSVVAVVVFFLVPFLPE